MNIDVQTPEAAAGGATGGAYQLDSMDRENNVGRLVHRVRHALVTHIDSALASLDLTAAQWTVVVYLAEDLASTPAELSRLLHYDPGAMTRLIDRLEKKTSSSAPRATPIGVRSWSRSPSRAARCTPKSSP